MVRSTNTFINILKFHMRYAFYSLLFMNPIEITMKLYNTQSFIIPSILIVIFAFNAILMNGIKNVIPIMVFSLESIMIFVFHVFILSGLIYNNIPLNYRFNQVHFNYIFTTSIIHLPILQILYYFIFEYSISIFIGLMCLYSVLVSINLYKCISLDTMERFKEYVFFFAVISFVYHSLLYLIFIHIPVLLINTEIFSC